jgi:plastocyanin
MMAAPYGRPMPVHWRNPGGGVMPAVSAPADKSRASEELQAASGESTSGGETVTVRINGMQFEPANITIKPGITVTWVHGSPMPHTVSGNDGGPQSNTLYSGQQYSHTFDATGRYDYVCDFHPSMKGSVIVEPSGTDA